MHQRLVYAAAGFLMLAAPLSAEAQDWYFGIEGGIEMDGHFDSGSDSGYAAIATVGRRFGPNFGVEGELGYRTVSYSLYNYDVDQVSLMLNGTYDVSLAERLSLSMGAGVGIDVVHLMLDSTVIFLPVVDDTEVKFAGQVKLGLRYAVSEATEVTVTFRNMNAYGGDFGDLHSSTLTAGLRFAL